MTLSMMITGPAGSGKSTTAAGWAARGTAPRAVIDSDALRTNVRAGVAHPEDGWTEETQRQWDVAVELWQAMLGVYVQHGVDCVVDTYAPLWPGDDLDRFLAEQGVLRVVLLPTLAVCLDRNRRRSKSPVLTDDLMTSNYRGFTECVQAYPPPFVIDNGDLTTAQTVDAVERIVEQWHRPSGKRLPSVG